MAETEGVADLVRDGAVEVTVVEEQRAIGETAVHLHVAFHRGDEGLPADGVAARGLRDAADAERAAVAVARASEGADAPCAEVALEEDGVQVVDRMQTL